MCGRVCWLFLFWFAHAGLLTTVEQDGAHDDAPAADQRGFWRATSILFSRHLRAQEFEYLVEWEGFDRTEWSYVTESSLSPLLLQEYLYPETTRAEKMTLSRRFQVSAHCLSQFLFSWFLAGFNGVVVLIFDP